MKKKEVTRQPIMVPGEKMRVLRDISAKTGISMAGILDRAFDLWLRVEAPPLIEAMAKVNERTLELQREQAQKANAALLRSLTELKGGRA
jgi:hypothetical protein